MSAALKIERAAAQDPPPAGFAALARSGDTDAVPPAAERWVASSGGTPRARLTTMIARDLVGAPGPSGLIGHYEAADADAGTALLAAACAALAGAGAARVVGPMNGSTWRRYRLALPHEPEDPRFEPPVFLSEPVNPPDYPRHFEGAGFTVADSYESLIETPLSIDHASQDATRARLAADGITLRALDPSRYDEELRALWALSLDGFAGNPWYSPIGWEEFRALYEPLRPRFDPRLVVVAEDRGHRPVGFMLAFADLLSERAGGPKRVICKSLAVSPATRGRGLGDLLLTEARVRAEPLGFTEAIDALMHVTNASGRISRRHGSQLFRRYALYRWTP